MIPLSGIRAIEFYGKMLQHSSVQLFTAGGGGVVLRFGLVGNVPSAAQGPYPYLRVISKKKYKYLVIFPISCNFATKTPNYHGLAMKNETHSYGFFFMKAAPMFRDHSCKNRPFFAAHPCVSILGLFTSSHFTPCIFLAKYFKGALDNLSLIP